ncbi:MAG: hypothetical protein MRECE_1c093 [Mycoplasmataceae bacterium CE_OT135]|nr:MAG: hypothetical protein MRECE_1c075 [Mycoplasmataceae bacterium CE_OT135]KLL04335.1 MAG: hypothetical protein MRECE_1c093 [Mycoplasmataceae bacterium CE_OT135]
MKQVFLTYLSFLHNVRVLTIFRNRNFKISNMVNKQNWLNITTNNLTQFLLNLNKV